jgi:hypothetical protein
MESTTALIVLMAALFLTAGAFTASSMISVWTPAPKPFIERVLLVGGDLLVDVRNPSDRPLSCTVYNAGIVLRGPSTIPPGKVATYTGPAAGRDVVADCASGDDRGKAFSIAYQVPGVVQAGNPPNGRGSGSGDGGGDQGSSGGGGNGQGSGAEGGSQGGSGQGGGPELRHFSCEVRHVGNRRMVRIHANLQAVVNQGAKPYNFTIDFGDGVVEMSVQEGSAYTTNHLYSGTGPYIARLIVTDALNRTAEALLEVPGGCRNV